MNDLDYYSFEDYPSYTDRIFYALSKYAKNNYDINVLEYDRFRFKGLIHYGI